MKRVFVPLIVALLLVFRTARAQGPDEQYVQIYNLIQDGDSLANQGQPNQALAKYLEARTDLQRFQKAYSDWNSQVVNFRLSYLNNKIAGLSEKGSSSTPPATTEAQSTTSKPAPATAPPTATPPSAAPATAPVPAAAAAAEPQLAALREQVRELQAERTVLEAKLKEALAAQPAAFDPRELAKAEDKIKSLQKENDLLKVSLDQAKSKPAPTSDLKGLDQAKKALAEANRNLAEQTQRAATLEAEKKVLQNKLDSLAANKSDGESIAATRKALEEANRQLAEQKQLAGQLALEKEALQRKAQSGSATTEAVASLRAENELLKKQIADLRAPAVPAAKVETPAAAMAQVPVAPTTSREEKVRLERAALENRIQELSGKTPVTKPPVVQMASSTPDQLQEPAKTGDAARIKQLERERDDLQKKLEAALKTANKRKSKGAAGRVDDLENKLSALQARLDVFEARKVPYSAEELALFKAPEPTLNQAEANPGKKSVRELPPGTASLVAEAQRYFSAKRLDKAEEKYLEVLHKDERNVYTLANLAAIQLELGHTEEAEKHIQQAVALAPNDAYGLSILGYLRFKQQKYDESLDALSRAAKLEPENAEIQNYLGLTLSQKGLRAPAEAALRKAVQIDPNYGSAHNNLAVIYLNQQPPAVELARWHYQKALAAGHPRNPELERMLESKKLAESGK